MPHIPSSNPQETSVQRFIHWLIEPALPMPPEQHSTSRLLMSLLLILIATGSIYQILYIWLSKSLEGLGETAIAIAALIAAYALCRRGYLRSAAVITILLPYLAILALIVAMDNPQGNVALLTFSVIPLLISSIFFSNAVVGMISALFSLGILSLMWFIPAITLSDLLAEPLPFLWIVTGVIHAAMHHRNTIETERQKELAVSEARFRMMFKNHHVIMLLIEPETGAIIDANAAAQKFYGYSIDALKQMKIQDINTLPPEEVAERRRRALYEKLDFFVTPHRIASGEIRTVEVYTTPIIINDKPTLSSIIHDITERKQAEEALSTTEARFRALFHNVPMSGIIYRLIRDAQNEIVDWEIREINELGAADIGQPSSELIGKRAIALFGAEVMNPYIEISRSVAASNQSQHFETHFAHNDKHYLSSVFTLASDYYANMSVDITESKRAEEKLRASEEKYRVLMESLDSIVATVDRDGKYLYLNDVAAEQFDGDAENLAGKTMYELYPEAIAALQLERIQKVIDDDMGSVYESVSLVHKKPRWYRTSIQPIHDDAGHVTQILINATDIHDLKIAQQKLQDLNSTLEKRVEERTAEVRQNEEMLRKSRDELSAANASLEKAARMKDEFLASMSHELRTPLTSILGLSEALQLKTYGNLDERQLKTIKYIEESGQHLLELINDILDLAKIEAEKLELQIAPCSLTDICQSSLQLIKGLAEQKQIQVNYTQLTEPINLLADARRVKQILVNLLSNAVKFTPKNGEIGLEVQANKAEQQIRFTVWDNGIGIKNTDMHKLFKPFTQIDSSLAREYAGTGLGLSLVQRLAELHNGGVEVQSVFGKSSRFIVTLPWRQKDQMAAQTMDEQFEITHAAADVNPASPLVMIVDDNEQLLDMLADFLETKRYRTIKVRSGMELIKRSAEAHPDLMLVDIQMPGMDGLEAIRHIRNHTDKLIAATPIIAVTALAMPGDRERCLAAGANEYMSKPVKLTKLAEIIKKQIGKK